MNFVGSAKDLGKSMENKQVDSTSVIFTGKISMMLSRILPRPR